MKSVKVLVPLVSLFVISGAVSLKPIADNINGRSVEVFTSKVNWFQANVTCHQRGKQLLHHDDSRYAAYIMFLLDKYDLPWTWTQVTDPSKRSAPFDRRCTCIQNEIDASTWTRNDCQKLHHFICEQIHAFEVYRD